MKKTALILSIIFIILTFLGVGYVFYHGGKANAGYTVIPMILHLPALLFIAKTKVHNFYFAKL